MTEPVRQKQLVNVTVALDDTSMYAKYVFPFFGADWKVRLHLIDAIGSPPRRWSGPASFEGGKVRIATQAKNVLLAESMDPASLEGLLHFDPWWAFRGAPVPENVRAAVIKTNVAGRYHELDFRRKVEDVAFDVRLEKTLAVHTVDEKFRRRIFQEGELDLAKLRA